MERRGYKWKESARNEKVGCRNGTECSQEWKEGTRKRMEALGIEKNGQKWKGGYMNRKAGATRRGKEELGLE